MLAAIPAAALMKLPAEALARLELGLLVGTPGLAALTLMVARSPPASAASARSPAC